MKNTETSDKIEIGDYLVVQRQGYTKLHKLKKHGNLLLGSFTIEMDNVIGEKYYDTFQMKNMLGNKKFYILEKVDEINTATGSVNIEKSGADNRHIPNNADSQGLTKDDIDKLKNAELSSNNIVEQLISNSKTFNMKTEYSQEKYIKKKEKKYFEYIQIRKPTIRLLSQMFYRQDPTKTLGIRMDDLSQILSYANIHSEGNHLLYDSGTSGLMPAAIMNAIGNDTTGSLIHMHPGNECQKNGFVAMQYPREQIDRCINVNLYSVLRCFYQNKAAYSEKNKNAVEENPKLEANTSETNIEEKSCTETDTNEDTTEPSAKKPRLEEGTSQKRQWELENEKACRILESKVDSLIVTAKEHPVNIVKELLQFLKGGRSFVVFSLLKEPLQDLYGYLKSRVDIISIRISNNFMRNYQVLPDRTHPEVNMNTGGYILTGFKLSC
ncbi:tRNA (adenine(58)-N(1))-methyltransferase non-catalytic subunit TRM6 [Anoplophora glabripennis]|uniref:tRNA (adenine(58)-N(1))-methyltransferase non-catalytic subunit TRM6 n=1 Tax=Anoplophora glabripennis TaxID=217634 RepID=UPI0008744EF1|nr:tRNA (adenine(58)-N(1))-methyltransferase non-catalytic subunit TRM6 [Anoplophora glabripennis]